MKDKQNLLLVGKMGSGKSTLAQLLCQTYGYVCVPLAASLKQEAKRLIGRDLDKKTDRRFLQLFGQACRDGIDKDYWCTIAKKQIDQIKDLQ